MPDPTPARSKTRDLASLPTYELFKLAYWDRPSLFASECIRWPERGGVTLSLTDYQAEVMDTLPREKREAVRGPHGLGKTALAAILIHWFALTRDGLDWKIPTTASRWAQLADFLWPEVHKWARLLRWDRIGRPPYKENIELQKLGLKLATGGASAHSPDRPASIEGAHADHLLYVFDESKAIPADVWNAVEGAFSGAGSDTAQEAFWLAISTPGDTSGRFYEIHKRRPGLEDWSTRHVTVEEAISAGRISREWVEKRRRQWGGKSAVFQNRVLGEFATQAEDSVIPLDWAEQAMLRWRLMLEHDALPPLSATDQAGLDVADGGEDASIYAPRAADVVIDLYDVSQPDTGMTMQLVGACRPLFAPGMVLTVDNVGVGSGVYYRLRELVAEESLPAGMRVVPFNAGEGTKTTDQTGELGFVDKRSAAWWMMRMLLDPQGHRQIALPEDDDLLGQLTAPRWSITSGGRIRVESKKDIKKRIGRSTDDADAVIQSFWRDAEELVRAAGVVPDQDTSPTRVGLGREISHLHARRPGIRGVGQRRGRRRR